MKDFKLPVYICIAMALGFLGGVLWGKKAPDDTPVPDPESGTKVVERTQSQEGDFCTERLADCEQRLEFASNVIDRQVEERTGTPVPFPEDIPPQYTGEGFETAVHEALAECGVDGLELALVDCSEFPCMAFFSQTTKSYNHAVGDLRSCEGWTKRFERGGTANSSFMTNDGVAEYSMASVYPRHTDSDENSSTRFRTRLAEGESALMELWGGREFTELEGIEMKLEILRDSRERAIREEDAAVLESIDDYISDLEIRHSELTESDSTR